MSTSDRESITTQRKQVDPKKCQNYPEGEILFSTSVTIFLVQITQYQLYVIVASQKKLYTIVEFEHLYLRGNICLKV